MNFYACSQAPFLLAFFVRSFTFSKLTGNHVEIDALTYMSILDDIERLKLDNRIGVLPARFPNGQAETRVILAEASFFEDLMGAKRSTFGPARMADLRVTLDSIILGGVVTIGGPKTVHCDAKPLTRTWDVWEIKGAYPPPSLRVFGSFVAKGVFLATHVTDRRSLGRAADVLWKKNIRKARNVWKTLLGNQQPVMGGTVHDYIPDPIFDRSTIT